MRRLGRRLRGWGAERLTLNQKLVASKLRHGEYDWQKRIFSKPVPSRVLAPARGYDARRVVADNLETVVDILRVAGIESVVLPRVGVFNPILVISETHIPDVVQALSQLSSELGWTIHGTNFSGSERPLSNFAVRPDSLNRIRCRRHLVAANGRELTTRFEDVVIEPWALLDADEERVDGETHIPGTLHRRISKRGTLVEYLTPAVWQRAQAEGGRLRLSHPHLYEVVEPIDIVYTWVDGDDPEWRQRKLAAEGNLDRSAVNETATIASRFTSRDELKYSLRSVEAYASWVNHIFIVTDGQVPDWLDTDNPKITVVDHREIFSDTDALPVFNSHAIESQLHHIPGLNENYVYLNDDIVFLRPTDPSLFFTGSGQSKFFPSTAPLDFDPPTARDLPVLSAAKRNRELILSDFGRVVTNKFKHTLHPQLRSVLMEMEAEHSDEFAAVARSTFRHPCDLSISSSLYHYYAYAKRRAIPDRIRYAYMDIAREDAELYLRRLARRTDLDVLCLNDTNTDGSDQDRLDKMLRDFLADRLPIPSSFEKTGIEQNECGE